MIFGRSLTRRTVWLVAVASAVVAISGEVAAQSPGELPRFALGGSLEASAFTEPEVNLVQVFKAERRLALLSGEDLVSSYGISLGSEPVGPKREQGDGRTPEGRYVIDWRKSDSDFHLALHISYPNEEDNRRAEESGVDPGGSIMIHGLPNGIGVVGAAHTVVDWTDGCIAVTNAEIEEIWNRVPDGVPIEIWP